MQAPIILVFLLIWIMMASLPKVMWQDLAFSFMRKAEL
jgi:hypothetical protein